MRKLILKGGRIGLHAMVAVLALSLVGCPKPPPSITSVDNTEVLATESETITLTGTGFQVGADVTFAAAKALPTTVDATYVSETELTVESPVVEGLAADITVNMTVTNPDGQSSAVSAITYLAPPTIATATPTSVPAQVATAINLTGTNFDAAATYAFMNGSTTLASGSVTYTSATAVSVNWPGLAGIDAPIASSLVITNADGQTDTTAIAIVAPPTVSAIVPSDVPASLVTTIAITGNYFQSGATATFVRADGVTILASGVATTFLNSQALSCSTPQLLGLSAPEAITVMIVNPDLQETEAKTGLPVAPVAVGTVTYHPGPDATGIDVATVRSTISDPITLTGTNFREGSVVIFRRASDSLIAEVPAVVGDSTTLTCSSPTILSPRLTTNEVMSLEVVGPQGQASPDLQFVTYVAPPFITSFTPATDPVPASTGATFTFVGSNLAATMDVNFTIQGGAAIGTTVATSGDTTNGTSGANLTPTKSGLAANTTVEVEVENPDGQVSLPVVTTTYAPEPSVTSILNDATGKSEVGATIATAVTITGTNFVTGATLEFFRADGTTSIGTPAATFVDASTLTCTTPALGSGVLTADEVMVVKVTNPDGQVTLPAAKAHGSINYQAEPTLSAIASVDPGTAPGPWDTTRIPSTYAVGFTLTGTNFSNLQTTALTATFDFSGIPLANADAAATVTAETTAGGTATPIISITADAVVPVTVTDVYGQTSGSVNITYSAPPIVTQFHGTVVGGTDTNVTAGTVGSAFTIDGSNFQTNATAAFYQSSPLTDQIGSAAALTMVTPGTEMSGTTPAIADLSATLNTVQLQVTNPDGQKSAEYGSIKYVAPAKVTSIDIAHVVPAGLFSNVALGTYEATFTLTGTNFDSNSPDAADGTVAMTLSGGALATNVTIVSDTSLTFQLQNNGNSRLADIIGYLDIVSITDNTNQVSGGAGTEALADALLTVLGPEAANDRYAQALAVGQIDGPGAPVKAADDSRDDLVVVSYDDSAASLVVQTWYGVDDEALSIVPDTTATVALGTSDGLMTPGSRNATIADINGDGYGDVIVGVPDYNFITATAGTNNTSGAVHVFMGSSAGMSTTPVSILGSAAIAAAIGDEGFGASVAAGDFNGDGIDDLAVGAPGQIGGSGSTGVVHLYLGNVSGITSAVADVTFDVAGAGLNDGFGLGLAIGDWNDDGYADLFGGSPGFDTTLPAQADTGRVWLFYGAMDLNNSADLTFTGAAAGATAGYPTMGDFDGDGVADLLIGSAYMGAGFAGSGSAGSVSVILGADDTAGDYTLTVSGGAAEDSAGTCAGTLVLSAAEGTLIGGANITGAGVGTDTLDQDRLDTGVVGNVFAYTAPTGINLDAAGDMFGAYVEGGNVIDNDAAVQSDLFISVLNGFAGVDVGTEVGALVVMPR